MTTDAIDGTKETKPLTRKTPAKRIKLDPCVSSVVKGSTMAQSVTPTPSVGSNASTSESPKPLSSNQIEILLQQEASYDCTADGLTPKRSGYLSWDDYFMAVASLSAQRSKDPKASKGACIVNADNRVVGIGYNGFPRGCSDDVLPWIPSNGNETTWLKTSAPYECHAEVNAILNKCSSDVVGARLYVAHFPCNECAKVIVQSRIGEVVYLHDLNADRETYRASRIMFTMAGVTTRQLFPVNHSIVLNLMSEVDLPVSGAKQGKPQNRDDQTSWQYRDLLVAEANLDPTTTRSSKRTDYLSWDDYFMAMAFLTAQRSKDPNTQVGACIVDKNQRIIGLGYNGFPRGCSDEHLPWSRNPAPNTPQKHAFLHRKYAYVCHAEVNAILNKCSADVKDATLYVALFPCNECAKVIIQAGISEVVYMSDRYHDDEAFRASRILLGMAGVKMRQHAPNVETVDIKLNSSGHRPEQ